MLEKNGYVIVNRKKNFMLLFTFKRLRRDAVKELEKMGEERWHDLKKIYTTAKCKIIVET